MASLVTRLFDPPTLAKIATVAFLAACVWPDGAHGLPGGRAWAPTTWLLDPYPRVSFFGVARMETNDEGLPFFIIDTRYLGAASSTWNTFAWGDSQWVHRVNSDIPGFDVQQVALSLSSTRHMVWLAPPDPFNFSRMVTAEYTDHGFGHPDTAMVTLITDTQRSGAASKQRRWVVRAQPSWPFTGAYPVRTAYSDTFGIWRELPQLGVEEFMCTMAPLSDESAIVVYAGESGLGWAVAEDDHWAGHGILDSRPLRSLHPRFAFRRSGGLWLMWSDRRWIHLSSYANGQWSWGDSIQCVHPAGQTFIPAWTDLTHDGGERPVLAWIDVGYGTTFRDVGCVAFPNDSGWAAGEEIPGSDNIFLNPYVCKDLNGDVWVSWRVRATEKNRWTHTYVKATSTAPSVAGTGRDRALRWTLSEPAPESWWAVLRARNEGPFEQVARVEAGETTGMSWIDSSPPAGMLRYRIRRESVDTRYQWETEDAFWPAKAHRALTLSRTAATQAEGDLELSGAVAGALLIRIFDIQGRVVHEQTARSLGTGRDSIDLDLSQRTTALPNGIYFAAVKDASGQVTNSVKLVILR